MRGPQLNLATISSPFTPRSLGDAVLWVRADDPGIVISTGVSLWPDRSGLGHDLTQGIGTRQPTLVTNSAPYGHRPVFSAATTQFIASTTWGAPIAPPYSIFLVGQCDNSLFYAWNGTTNEASVDVGGLGWRLISDPSNFSTAGTTTNPSVIIAILDGASSKLYVSQNTPTNGVLGTNALDQAAIFGRQDGLGTGNGICAEAAIFTKALNTNEIAQLNAYANARYGIAIGA